MANKKKSSPKKSKPQKSSSSSKDLSASLQRIEERLNAIEGKLELLGGVTREYLESNFSKLTLFDKERQTLLKVLDQHESRINSLEGF